MFIFFLIVIIIFLFFCNNTIEKFWVYGTGTRICNNRECDVIDRGEMNLPVESGECKM